MPDGQAFVLHPGEFVLASTLEVISLGDQLAGRLEGKSSLGRLGLLTHSTAGFIDPGFSGHVTLELSNVANLPITLWPGMKIGQLCIFRLSSPPSIRTARPSTAPAIRVSAARRPVVPGRAGAPGPPADTADPQPGRPKLCTGLLSSRFILTG